MEDSIFPFNFEGKNRKIEISKIVDTSGPKIGFFKIFPHPFFLIPGAPRGIFNTPWGPRGPPKIRLKIKFPLGPPGVNKFPLAPPGV